ncbi:acetate--CoA ligase family protein [Mesorhizobium sp. YC-39]|uniref:acetate--CoA ligase family protein n=1 Tax=unclassified Mesorhizobium TaxID=325217 RepID=UPI0021E880BC|nr:MULTISPECIES: acetate--CoA ligase [unclassified Mesorhizobium]MCV3205152.1 acetate--CoA ligase family protein [Mesorhizobium sp. YC-2]MCV3228449.1 acetate--CoA ligase family protein [Mesorhizobium sp. YC-39]
MTGSAASHEAMRALMAPRSVAVIGATERADASSSYVMRNLLAFGFSGAIVPVHPKAETVFGIPAIPSLDRLDAPADVAVIGIGAAHVLTALEDAGKAGVKAAVVLASGFAETDGEGKARQQALVAIARKYGMAICGPNCLGLFNLQSGAALYSSTLSPNLKRGALAILSHSGASAIALANSGRFGLSHIVSCGNSAATDLPDYLSYLAGDEATRVIGLVVEAIRDPAAFTSAMQAGHVAGKQVIALRAGKSSKGAEAAAAHTGSLAAANEAYEAFFRRTGIIEVADMDEFVETATLCLSLKARPARKGVAVVGVSGGGVAHVSDIAEQVGIELPEFSQDTIARLKALLPPFATPQNPVDTTGVVFADSGVYRSVLAILAQDASVGLIVAAQDAPVGLDADGAAEYVGIADAVASYAKHATVPVAFISNLSSGHHPAVRERLAGVPVLNGTRASLNAVRGALDATGATIPNAPAIEPADENDPWSKRLATGGNLTEREAKQWLADNGLRVTRERLAVTAQEAVEAAEAIGFPVVLKIESPDIPHKTEAGGVRLGIANAAEAAEAFTAIMQSARAHAPDAELRGVVVQEMAGRGVEALVGLVRHEPFGLGIVVGVGGVLVELVKDAAFDLLPVDRDAADALIDRTRLAALLGGYRGAPPADREALVETIMALSNFASRYGHLIEAVDLNPVVVFENGACVLDALVIPANNTR